MKRIALNMNCALSFVIAGVLAAGPAFAEKPAWAGDGKGDKGGRKEQRDNQNNRQQGGNEKSRDHAKPAMGGHFDEHNRVVVRDYYQEQFRSGRCPPGLRKKHNGCMPPGQAKKWQLGRPLPRDVIFYDVPPALIVQLGQPPARHRYVRVASDILLIAIGTGMVIDAIQDINGM
jgi:Ni/Co efflux regulator RcnB